MNKYTHMDPEIKVIRRIKRSYTDIDSIDNIASTNDFYEDFARKIFYSKYATKYADLDLNIYQVRKQTHRIYRTVHITPHFIRDDRCVIYIQLIQNKKYLLEISKELIHATLDTIGLNKCIVFTFYLKPNIDIVEIDTNDEFNYNSFCTKVSETIYKFDKEIAESYYEIESQPKRRKLTDSTNIVTDIDSESDDDVITGFEPNLWVSASKTRNYALKDTLIDWLDHYGNKTKHKIANIIPSGIIPESKPRTDIVTNDFTTFLMNKGNQFEENVISYIEKKFSSNEFKSVVKSHQNFYSNVLNYEKQTIQYIKSGIPIIYQPLLMNRSGPLKYSYGMPDLIVRSDYLDKLIDNSPLTEVEAYYPAPELNGTYHYVVIDIKFTTIELCSDGMRIRNNGSIPAYKCQLYIYNHALGEIQGYEPTTSYILGRKYKYVNGQDFFYINNCFDRVGHIKYDEWDANYIEETESAINWIKKLRTDGVEWKLLPKPTVPELYPNMSTQNDSHWSDVKTEYANKIGEITLLWNCGVKHREIAHNNGIYSIRDPLCTAKRLGINGPKQGPILNEIIRINKTTNFKSDLDKIKIKINPDFENIWIDPYKLRITVDFETIGSVFDDFSRLPSSDDSNRLFMIGISYKLPHSNPIYKSFVATELSSDAEYQIIKQFYNYMKAITIRFCGKKSAIPPLYHWGSIERTFFNRVCNDLQTIIDLDSVERDNLIDTSENIKWYDMSTAFKSNPIVINGCYKFGLKEISNRLYELNLIKTTWPKNGCLNGNTAMILAQRMYSNSKRSNTSIRDNQVLYDITEYNKCDCNVIHEIIDLLRSKVNI